MSIENNSKDNTGDLRQLILLQQQQVQQETFSLFASSLGNALSLELFADIVEYKELVSPISNNLSINPCRMYDKLMQF